MTKPVIGITTRRLPASGIGAIPPGIAHVELDGVMGDYSEAVAVAGGVPVLISRFGRPQDVVEVIDGLVLSGGEDVEPRRFGGNGGPHSTAHDPFRDEYELALIEVALERGIPILGICRGAQILNVALGGTLVEHLAETDGFSHAATHERPEVKRHRVSITAGSTLAKILEPVIDLDRTLAVNSFHHQAVLEPGHGLVAVASAPDGVTEAIEMADRAVVGVQWHPEWHEGCDPLFPWLISEAASTERQP